MAAIVQSLAKFRVSANNTVTGTWTDPTVSGNVLVITGTVFSTAGFAITITDSSGGSNTWTTKLSPLVSTNRLRTFVSYTVSAAATTTVTVTSSGTAGSTYIVAAAIELYGMNTGALLDHTEDTASSGVQATLNCPVTTTSTYTITIGAHGTDNGGSITITSPSSPAVNLWNEGNGVTYTTGSGDYRTRSTAGAADMSVTTSVNANHTAVCVTLVASADWTSGIVLDDIFEGSSFNLASSSVSGTGSASTVTIEPRHQLTNTFDRWWNLCAKATGCLGLRPTFVANQYANPAAAGKLHLNNWVAARRFKYSYDFVTWFDFDTAHTVGASTITFRNSTAFTGDTVYIAHSRIFTPTMMTSWITTMAGSYASNFVDWAAGSSFSLGSIAAQTDELSRQTLGPFQQRAFKVKNDGLSPSGWAAKLNIFFQGGQHASEQINIFVIRYMVEYLLSGAAIPNALLSYFNFWFAPMVNPLGIALGAWRSDFETTYGPTRDPNRWWSASVYDGHPKMVQLVHDGMATEFSGKKIQFYNDLHGDLTIQMGDYVDDGNTYAGGVQRVPGQRFEDAVRVYWTGPFNHNGGAFSPTSTADIDAYERYQGGLSNPYFMTWEFGENPPLTDTDLQSIAQAILKGINDIRIAGNVDYTAAPTATFVGGERYRLRLSL